MSQQVFAVRPSASLKDSAIKLYEKAIDVSITGRSFEPGWYEADAEGTSFKVRGVGVDPESVACPDDKSIGTCRN